TISTTTVTGTSETTTRQLQNSSTTDPMRIDYFSMMRKWRVRLYRYGLRLTYDIAIPEPGGAIREAYENLARLQAKASQVFAFDVPYSSITRNSYQGLATKYGAQVSPPPDDTKTQSFGGPIPGLTNDDKDESWHFNQITVNVPEGYAISRVFVEVMASN